MKKVVITIMLLAGALAAAGAQAAQSWTITNAAVWIDAVNAIRNGGNDRSHTLIVSGATAVPISAESTFGTVTGITVTIEGGGALSPTGFGPLLIIGGGQTVVIRNVTLGGRARNTYPAVTVGEGGVFRMESGASVAGNGGGGVAVYGGAFAMRDDSMVTGNSEKGGGGGGVLVTSGTFDMRDNASVTSNTAINGGGVLVSGGTFAMTGSASVSGNTAMDGGGVAVSGAGAFNMEGGAVSGNTAYNHGGGVYAGHGGSFAMRGGVIAGNTAGGCGAGVFGAIDKTGGTIYGGDTVVGLRNTAGDSGHAVYSDDYWRNATAGPAMNTDTYGFWLNDE